MSDNNRVLVWDLPTRLFHWLLVASYAGAYFTSRSEWFLEYHTVAGYLALGLVLFRILWGFAGNRYARFSDFVKGFGPVRDYLVQALRLKPRRYLGHNPAVGIVVIFMLLMTLAIGISGIIVYGGEEGQGFWADAFSYDTAQYAKAVHSFLTTFAILAIIVHVSAALFHDFILRENIILSMITGRKEDDRTWEERVSHLGPEEGRSKLRLAAWLLVAVLGGLGLVYLPPDDRQLTFTESEQPLAITPEGTALKVPVNATWKKECGTSCHNAFHPTLLPAESWKKVMSGLGEHFGDDASIDDASAREVLEYLLSYSAERSSSEASAKMLRSIRPDEIPMRITEVRYWQDKHSGIKPEVFKRKSVGSRSNCLACHPGAEVGSFKDKDIRVPEN